MYATVDDYMKRFDAPADMERLEAKLSDASLAVAAALRADGIDPEDPPAHIQDALVLVTCSVANRIMPLGSDITPGASSSMTTAGPYMSQQTFATPYGTPKLLPSELSLLGIGGSAGRMLHPKARPQGGFCPWRRFYD